MNQQVRQLRTGLSARFAERRDVIDGPLAAGAAPDNQTTWTEPSRVGEARIEDELATLKAEVEGFIASPPDRPSTLVRRLDAFETLKMRAALYRDVLQVHVQDLEKTLSNLAESVETLLSAKAA